MIMDYINFWVQNTLYFMTFLIGSFAYGFIRFCLFEKVLIYSFDIKKLKTNR